MTSKHTPEIERIAAFLKEHADDEMSDLGAFIQEGGNLASAGAPRCVGLMADFGAVLGERDAMLDALRDSVARWENKLKGDGFDPNPGPVWLQNYRAILAKFDGGAE